MEKQMKAVWAILAMLTFWVTFNSTKVNNTASEQQKIDLLVANMVARLTALEQVDEQEEATRTLIRVESDLAHVRSILDRIEDIVTR